MSGKYGFGFNSSGGGGGGGGTVTVQVGVVAFAAGGQAGATALTAQECFIATAAAPNASVQLLAAVIGMEQTVHNNGANDVNVYPIDGGTDNFINQAANTPISLPAAGMLTFVCGATGIIQYY